MKNLQQKLYQRAYEEQLNKRQSNRKMQVGTSSRSERIRTYNFIQDRITDHRLGENFHSIPKFLNGDTLDEMINSLRNEQKVEILYEMIDKFNNETKK
jgi:peptide chain release factor 1